MNITTTTGCRLIKLGNRNKFYCYHRTSGVWFHFEILKFTLNNVRNFECQTQPNNT